MLLKIYILLVLILLTSAGGSGCTGAVKNLAGDSCISICPSHSTPNAIPQCVCDTGFQISTDKTFCACKTGSFDLSQTSCVSTCPSFSSPVGGFCQCIAPFVSDGTACGCTGSLVANLAGNDCISGCPAHSSFQGEQCQCSSPWVLETVNKASCVCPSTLSLSLDELNCITPCPSHSIIVSNACICDGTWNFVLSADKQSCECQTGMIYDSSLDRCLTACSGLSPPGNVYPYCYPCDGTCKTCSGLNSNQCLTCNSGMNLDSGHCLPACSTLSPPNNVPPYCYQCDGTCKTCLGPNSNQCLTCYSGYQLSDIKTCKAVTKTSSPSSPSVDTAKATQAMSSASIAASAIASAGNSGAMRVSLVGNMFQYLKYMNISYSEQLGNMLENLNSQFLPFDLDVEVPHSMQDESNYKTLAYQFTKYDQQIHPSFLMNFWDDLSVLVLVIGIVGVLVGFQFLANKFYNKKKTLCKTIFSKASLMAQSFVLTYTYNDLGSIIFYGLLDFKSAKKYSGVHVFNLIVAISLLLAEVGILTTHYTLLVKYRKIKRARLTQELEEFLEKHENLKAFFEDFNDFSFIQQGFLLVAIIRDMLSNLILVTLYQYPLAESTCFMAFSILMIMYILYSGPFKEILNAIQQILCEGILLLVNTCVFINAVMDHIDSKDSDTRKSLGSIVVTSNIVFNFVPIVFLGITLWQISKEFYGWMKKRKIAKLRKTEDLSLKTDSSNIILRNHYLEDPIRNVTQENRNLEILGSSQNQTMMSKDHSGIFEVKLGQDELITEHRKEKSHYWTNENSGGIRRAKIKKRRVFPYPQQNALSIGEMRGEVKFEGHNTGK